MKKNKKVFYETPCIYTVSQKQSIFLSSLCQISTNVDTFWHKDGQDDKIMQDALIIHLIQLMSMHYRVKHRCSRLLHYTLVICIRLLTFASSI